MDGIRNKLVIRSAEAFKNINETAKDCITNRNKNQIDYQFKIEELEECAKEYLKAIDEYLFGMRQINKIDLEEYSRFRDIRIFWHLFQITYCNHGLNTFSSFYLEWLDTNFVAPLPKDVLEVINLPNPLNEPNFKHFLIKSIFRGKTQLVISLLKFLPTEPLVNIVSELYSKMPRHKTKNENQFEADWYDWKRECKTKAENYFQKNRLHRDSVYTPILRDTLMIMADYYPRPEEYVNILARYCQNWIELFGALVLFSFPSAPFRAVTSLLPFYAELLGLKIEQCSTLDQCAYLLLTSDLFSLLQKIKEFDPWVNVHMADLLEKRIILEDFNFIQDEMTAAIILDIRKPTIEDYIKTFDFSSNGQIQDATLIYLNGILWEDTSYVEKYINELPLNNVVDVDRLLELCNAKVWNLYHDFIIKKFFKHLKQNNMYAEGFKYLCLLKVPDEEFLQSAIKGAVVKFFEDDKKPLKDYLNSLVQFRNENLWYIEPFNEYEHLLEIGNWSGVHTKIIELLSYNNLPWFLAATLIFEFKKIYERHNLKISKSDLDCILKHAYKLKKCPLKDENESKSINREYYNRKDILSIIELFARQSAVDY